MASPSRSSLSSISSSSLSFSSSCHSSSSASSSPPRRLSSCSDIAADSTTTTGSCSATCSGTSCTTHVRSISLPSKPNPVLQKLEGQLIKLKEREESSTSASQTIAIGLSGMVDLYGCIYQALRMPVTQQALFFHHKGACIEDLVEASSSLLDLCNSTTELVLQLRESARDLRSALSPCCTSRPIRGPEYSIAPHDDQQQGRGSIAVKCSIASYIYTRKSILKVSKGILLVSLNKVDDRFGQQLPPLSNQQGQGQQLSSFIKALRCVSILNISILESLLFYLATPVACKPKLSRWSVASRFLAFGDNQNRGSYASAAASGKKKKRDEMGGVDMALRGAVCGDGKKVDEKKAEEVVKRLQHLEAGLEGILKGLAGTSEQLIKTRSSLLSIFSF